MMKIFAKYVELNDGGKISAELLGYGEPDKTKFLGGDGIWKTVSVANWEFQDKDAQTVYIYYGFSTSTDWKIKRKTIATEVWGTASGTGDYAIAWADRENKTYSY